MDPITFVARTACWKGRLNQSIVKSPNPANFILLEDSKQFKWLQTMRHYASHAGDSIINLLYLACLCITIYFKQPRQCLIMTVIQITTLKWLQLYITGVPRAARHKAVSFLLVFHFWTWFVYTAAVMGFFCLGLVWCCCCCLPPSPG